MPRVSVIMPAYNAARFLREALESVRAQTYRDWEVIVSDDASRDATADIAERFGSGFRVLRSPVNTGPAVARNRAIETSSGELLAFLDADDLWLPNYLERQVGLYDASRVLRNDVGIVACDARILGPEGLRSQTYMEVVRFPCDVTLARLLASNPIFITVLSPRNIVDEVGGFEPDLSACADYDLWLRIVERGYRVVANRHPLAVYRLTAASLSTNQDSGTAELERTYRRALERGMLTSRQRRIARRNVRLSRALQAVVAINQERRSGRSGFGRLVRAFPLLLRVKLEHPNQWLDSIRRATGRPTSTAALERTEL